MNANERTIQEATAHADYMLTHYAEPRAVFVMLGADQYGRDGMVYVRTPDDPEMLAHVNKGRAVTAYVAKVQP